MITKLELPKVDHDNMVSPHAQDVEYALILSRMITAANNDPAQMRAIIYEFARIKLEIDVSREGEAEVKRLSAALETAIQGVEDFSVRREKHERLEPPAPGRQVEASRYPGESPAISRLPIRELNSEPNGIAIRGDYSRPDVLPILDIPARALLPPLARFFVGIFLFGLVVGLAIYRERLPELRASLHLPSLAAPAPAPSPPPPQQTPVAAEAATAAISSSAQPFPLPGDYGVYAVSHSVLSELHPLSERVPDKRVAMSTPVSEPSRTTIPDGKMKFVVFRRDLAAGAPDQSMCE